MEKTVKIELKISRKKKIVVFDLNQWCSIKAAIKEIKRLAKEVADYEGSLYFLYWVGEELENLCSQLYATGDYTPGEKAKTACLEKMIFELADSVTRQFYPL